MMKIFRVFTWLVWLAGWYILIQSIAKSSDTIGILSFVLGMTMAAEILIELAILRTALSTDAPVYYFAAGGAIFTSTVFIGFILGGPIGLLACGIRLAAIGTLFILR